MFGIVREKQYLCRQIHERVVMNDEKKYPEIDEEDGSCMMASESEYGATAVVGADTDVLDDDVVYGVVPGTFGFYTDDPEEFHRHVEEMEAEINDPGTKWMSSEDVWNGVKKEFPWLQ